MMIRLLLAAAALALASHAIAAEPVMLNERVRVSGNYVRLGEMFRHVGDKADVVVAYAPTPGKTAVFDAQWLFNVARRYGFPGGPSASGTASSSIARAKSSTASKSRMRSWRRSWTRGSKAIFRCS